MTPITIRHLIFHPGSPKTGTSRIQNALFCARQSLLEQGFLYPLAGIPPERGVARGHHAIAQRMDPRQSAPKGILQDLLEALRTETSSHPDHAVILSSEEFFGAERIRHLSGIVKAERVTCYVSLRPQHEVMNANYYTQVTHKRATMLPGAYFDSITNHLRYLEILDALTEMGSRSTVHLRLFERGLPARSGPMDDFASIVGISLPNDFDRDTIEHPTLPAQPTLFLRWLNELGFDQQAFFSVFQSLHAMRSRLPRQMYTMSPGRIEAVTEYFEEENRQIRRRFIDGQDAPLFLPPEVPNLSEWNAEVGDDHAKTQRDFLDFLLLLPPFRRTLRRLPFDLC